MQKITTASNVGSVHYDVSEDSWDWAIHDIPILMGVKSQIAIEGGDGYKMISHAVEPFEDSVGKGSCLFLNYSTTARSKI